MHSEICTGSGGKSGALGTLRRAKLGILPVAVAALGLGFAPTPIAAQSASPIDTVEEAAICLTLQRLTEDLRAATDEERDWLERNRNNSRYSDQQFNTRVDRNNGKLEVLRGYIARYNRSCTTYRTSTLARICASNSGVFSLIYPTETCREDRQARN